MTGGADDALREAVASALGEWEGRAVEPSDVSRLTRLSTGTNRRTYRASVRGHGDVVVQVTRPGAGHGLSGGQQAALLRRAGEGDVVVPEVLTSGTHDDGPLAGHWTITRHVAGEAIPRIVLRALDGDGRRSLLAQVAAAAAAVHRLPTDGLPRPGDELAEVRSYLTATGPPDPAVALALRWLECTRSPPGPVGVVHGDLRLGNLLVDLGAEGTDPDDPEGSEADPPQLVALLDWELAHAGSVHADLGWFCGRAWRFGAPLAAGGLGTRDDLLDAYAAAGGEPPDRDALRWWELLGCVRWAAMCRIMGGDAARRDPPPLEPTMVGRRAAEAAYDCLRLLPGGVESAAPVAGGAGVAEPALPEEAPATPGSGRDLLAAAAADLDRRAEDPDAPRRWPARVAANAVRTAARQWWLQERNRTRHADRLAELGVADDDALRARIGAGAFDDEVVGLALVLAEDARDELAVVNPSWLTDRHGED